MSYNESFPIDMTLYSKQNVNYRMGSPRSILHFQRQESDSGFSNNFDEDLISGNTNLNIWSIHKAQNNHVTNDNAITPEDKSAQKDMEHNKHKLLTYQKYLKLGRLFSLTSFAENVLGPLLSCAYVKATILVGLIVTIGLTIHGIKQIKFGIDILDAIPEGTNEYHFLDTNFKYFSAFLCYMTVKDPFDYTDPSSQLLFHEWNKRFFDELPHIVNDRSSVMAYSWLELFRKWLKWLQDKLDVAIAVGCVTPHGWCKDIDHYSILAFKLLVQTDNTADPFDMSKIRTHKLVDDRGVIDKGCFYYALSAWFEDDESSYYASLNYVRPVPIEWVQDPDSTNLTVPRSKTLHYSRVPFWFNKMNDTEVIVDTIKTVRKINIEFKVRGLDSYPEGIPFLFWEQFLHLEEWMMTSIGASLIALFIVISLMLFNPWLAIIICSVIAISTAELYAYFALIDIKMSSIPAVVLVVSLGIGVEFTVHISLAFVNTSGSRNERMCKALKEMFAPVLHGGISTLLGIIMLAFSNFKLVVRYYFYVLAGLVGIGTINGLILLPVILSVFGPNADVVIAPKKTFPESAMDNQQKVEIQNSNNNNINKQIMSS